MGALGFDEVVVQLIPTLPVFRESGFLESLDKPARDSLQEFQQREVGESNRAQEMCMEEIERVNVGYDRVAATLAVERCRSSGIRVELLYMDAEGMAPGLAALQPHTLLVRTADLPAAREVIPEWFTTQ